MKIIKRDQAQEFKNSNTCTALEYPLGDPDINGAVIKLSGRYPDTGYASNEICKEMVYVISGHGQLTLSSESRDIAEGDLILLAPKERYYFSGTLTMFMPCTPAWYPEQHVVHITR